MDPILEIITKLDSVLKQISQPKGLPQQVPTGVIPSNNSTIPGIINVEDIGRSLAKGAEVGRYGPKPEKQKTTNPAAGLFPIELLKTISSAINSKVDLVDVENLLIAPKDDALIFTKIFLPKFSDSFKKLLDVYFEPKRSIKEVEPTSAPAKPSPAVGGGDSSGGLLLLGGIAALVFGLLTDGPFKGTAKIASKGLLAGVTSKLKLVFGTFYKALIDPIKGVFDNIIKTLSVGTPGAILKSITDPILAFGQNLYTSIKTVFANIGGSIIAKYKTLLSGFTGTAIGGGLSKIATGGGFISTITTRLGSLLKPLLPIFKKLPGIGTIISFGFAYSRFKSGDTIGGVIDILSGLLSAASVIPGVGLVTTPLAIGLDVLNAFLDYKAGGATGNQTAIKGDILKNWFSGAMKWLMEKIKMVFPIVAASEKLQSGDYVGALKLIPGVGFIFNLFDDTPTTATTTPALGNNVSKMQSTLQQQLQNNQALLTEQVSSSVQSIYDVGGQQIATAVDHIKASANNINKTVANINTATGNLIPKMNDLGINTDIKGIDGNLPNISIGGDFTQSAINLKQSVDSLSNQLANFNTRSSVKIANDTPLKVDMSTTNNILERLAVINNQMLNVMGNITSGNTNIISPNQSKQINGMQSNIPYASYTASAYNTGFM